MKIPKAILFACPMSVGGTSARNVPIMRAMLEHVSDTLSHPDEIVGQDDDPNVKRYYKWFPAATCTIQGNPGLLLVEAKAHEKELYEQDKCGSTNPDNLERILQALQGANHNLGVLTENNWSLSRDSHYQLSNRFAWSWKLALLGVPVVLVYLGFLNAQDMTGRELFHSPEDWKRSVHDYGKGVVGDDCWDKRLGPIRRTFLPLDSDV